MLELLIAVIVLLLGAIWIYNGLVRSRNQVAAAWSDFAVQLKRRHDLVPQLVTKVKAYADYEKATMTAVIELRKQREPTSRLSTKAQLEKDLASAGTRLLVVAED